MQSPALKGRLAIAGLLCGITLCADAEAPGVALATSGELLKACTALRNAEPARLRQDRDLVTFAICEGIGLLRDLAGWLQPFTMRQRGEALAEIRPRLESYLPRIVRARRALERIHATKPIMVIEPGRWVLDLDGDGVITPGERHFFRVPKRGIDSAAPTFGFSGSEEHYLSTTVAPRIKIDQSDIYWAIAYCHFAEAAINLVLAYDFGNGEPDIVLRDPERVRGAAYRSLLDGMRVSRDLRASLVAETTDRDEWIGNPRQRNTSFPLVMDEQTFRTWGNLLDHLDAMLAGRTLLGGAIDRGARPNAARELLAGLCDPNAGIDLRDLFVRPIAHPARGGEWQARCVPATAAKPVSGLAAMISEAIQRNTDPAAGVSGEWAVVRHLYWVN